jgi:fucose 4-O-acetylase-like acetyltransferase
MFTQTSSAQSRSARLAWPDYARGIAILLVVFRHLMDGLKRAGIEAGFYQYADQFNIIFAGSRIPVFFIVSGFFATLALNKKSTGQFLRERAGILLYPYLIWGSFQIVCQVLFPRWVNANRSLGDLSFLFYRPREIDQFWYLYALFNTSILFALCKTKLKWDARLQLAMGVITYFLGAWLQRKQIETGFLADIMRYALFFALGALLAEKRTQLNVQLGSLKLFALFILVFLALQWGYINIWTGFENFNDFVSQHPFYFLLMACSGAAMLISGALLLAQKQVAPILKRLGSYSLYIYIWHVFFVAGSRILLMKILHIQNTHILVIAGLAAGIICPILVYRVARKFGLYWLYRSFPDHGISKKRAAIQLANV